MQAQMMGMFPASNANNLTDWQQTNAIPPIKGANFKKWQDELGAAALPYGLNTFPIQQIGPEADTMLSMDHKNCARYGEIMLPLVKDANEKLESEMNEKFNSVWKQMMKDEISGSEMCDYLDWAYYARVALDGDMKEYQKIHETLCQSYYNSITHSNITVEWDNGLISNTFNKKLLEILQIADESEANTMAKPVSFFNFQTLNSDILNAFALSTCENPKMPTFMETLPASSSIVFEVNKDGTIKGFLNDQEYDLGGCKPKTPCKRSDFEMHLTEAVKKIPDVKGYCKKAGEESSVLN